MSMAPSAWRSRKCTRPTPAGRRGWRWAGRGRLPAPACRQVAGRQLLRLVGGEGVDQRALAVAQPRCVAQVDQLVGLDRDRDGLRHFFPGQVEDLAGGRGADRGDQHHVLLRQVGLDFLGDHLAHRARVLEVDAVDHADRARGDEIAAGDAQEGARHRRVGQALGEQRFDLDAGHAHGALDAFQRLGVGDAQALVEARRQPACMHFGIDLRPRAMHQHQADAHAVEQRDVVDQRLRGAGLAFADRLAQAFARLTRA
jgi:hypothetical protein